MYISDEAHVMKDSGLFSNESLGNERRKKEKVKRI